MVTQDLYALTTQLTKQDEEDRWIDVPLKEMKLFPLDEDNEEAKKLLEAEAEIKPFAKGISLCGQNFIVDPEAATTSLYQRGQIMGPIFKKLKTDEVCDILNTCYGARNGDARVLIRDGKVWAAHCATEYQVLPQGRLLTTLKKSLEKNFGVVSLIGAQIEKSYTVAVFEIDSPKAAAAIKHAMQKYGLNFDGKLLLKFVTSDTASSSVRLVPLMSISGSFNIGIGTPLSLAHRSNATVSKFSDLCESLYSLYERAPEKINELGKETIYNPVDCFLNLCKSQRFPKALSYETAELFSYTVGKTCTSLDIYCQLWEMIASGGLTGTAALNLEEGILRCLNLNIASYDKKATVWKAEF